MHLCLRTIIYHNGNVRPSLNSRNLGTFLHRRHHSAAVAIVSQSLATLGRYDLHGRGWSPSPPGARYDLAMHVQQLEALLDHIGAGTAPHSRSILAHSMGGVLAVAYCAAHPDLIASLMLLAPAGVMKAPFPGFRVAQAALSCMGCLLSRIGDGDPPPGDFHNLSDPDVAALSEWSLAWIRAHLSANTPVAFASSAARMPLTQMAAQVTRLAEDGSSYPVLLLTADNDPMVVIRPRDFGIYRQLGQKRLQERVFIGAGHCFFLEQASETHEVLLSFLAEACGGSSSRVPLPQTSPETSMIVTEVV